MARILLAWELGHGYGHVVPLRALAQALVAAGHEVLIAARDLLRVRRVFAESPVRILAAPFFPGLVVPAQQQCSLADVIWYEDGGHSAEVLLAQFLAWRELIAQLRIDLVIADAAPVALAASAGLARTLNYASFFHATDPGAWQIFRDWERIDVAACEQRARRLLEHLNAARAKVGLTLATTLAQGFGPQLQLIRYLPELDYAAPRTHAIYVGQIHSPGLAPDWPSPQLPRRLFAYLRKDYPLVDRLIGAFARLQDCSVLCFHDGLPADRRSADHVRFSTEPYDLAQVLPEADGVVCHGGGLHVLATQTGKPTLVMPLHTEQFLSARMGVSAGTSMLYLARNERPDFLPMLRNLLGNPALAANAQRIAAISAQRDPPATEAVLAATERLLLGAAFAA